MTEEMQTEIEKRIEVELESIWNGVRKGVEYKFKNFDTGFRAGAKFILELPEFREAVEILKFYGDEDNWMNPDAHVPYWTLWSDGANVGFNEAQNAISKLKALGIVNG